MDNPETLATLGTQINKTKHNKETLEMNSTDFTNTDYDII